MNTLTIDSIILLQKQRTKELFLLRRLKMAEFPSEEEINKSLGKISALENKIMWEINQAQKKEENFLDS